MLTKRGVVGPQIQAIIDSPAKTDNLAKVIIESCPSVDYSAPALKAKADPSTSAAALTSRPGLWVGSELEVNIKLGEYPEDTRPLQLLHAVIRGGQNDSSIADSFGGKEVLTARKATMGQLVREMRLVMDGEKGLFKKGQRYLLYVEGPDGSVYPVHIFHWFIKWRVDQHRFNLLPKWREGTQVYGN